MRVQVLVATMHQKDHSLPEKMNLQTDAIIANQCDRNEVETVEWKGKTIRYLSFAERGVGLNRNNALMRADGDVCLFADDDMVYVDGYEEKILAAFRDNPEADVILFNLEEKESTRFVIPKKMKVGYLNYLRYGTARVAFRLKPVKEKGIYFNQCFGGGTEHCHGEDNLFLHACLKEGLRLVALPITLASLSEERPSSWNTGYDEKYLRDQGILYRTISRRWWFLLCLQDCLRRYGSYGMGPFAALKIMTERTK